MSGKLIGQAIGASLKQLKRFQVPAIPTTQDQRTQKWMEAVASNLGMVNSSGLEGVPTRAELIQAGIAGPASGGGITYGPGSRNMTVPPKIEGLVARGAMDNIFLSWTAPAYANHALVEIWRSTVDDVGQAFQVGSTTANVYADNVGTAAVYRYWVRAVSREQVRGPYSDSVQGETGKDAAFMLTLLTGQIKESHLYQSFNERIDLIDLPETGLVSRLAQEVLDRSHASELLNQNLAQEVLDRGNADTLLNQDLVAEVLARAGGDIELGGRITTEEQARIDEDGALASRITLMSARVDDNIAILVTEQKALADQDEVLATQYTGLATRMGSAESAITSEQTARINADGAIASDVTTLRVSINDPLTGLAASAAAIKTEQTARVTADGALSERLDILTTRVGTAEAAVVTEQQARIDEDGVLASQYNGLVAKINDPVTGLTANSAAITEEQTARATADSAIGSRIDTLVARLDTPETGLVALIQKEETARVDRDKAIASDVTTLVSRLDSVPDKDGVPIKIEAVLLEERQARVDEDGALTSKYDGLFARMENVKDANGVPTGLTIEAVIRGEETARVTADEAVAEETKRLVAGLNKVQGANGETLTIEAAILEERKARVDEDGLLTRDYELLYGRMENVAIKDADGNPITVTLESAIATEQEIRLAKDKANSALVTTLQSRLSNIPGKDANGNPTVATLEQKMETQATVNNGLLAQYTLKAQIDQNGRVYVAGIALAAEAVAGNPATTSMILQADRVAIGNPGVNEVYPFILDKDGRIYLNMVTIAKGSITDAQIGTLTADTITGGTIQAINGIEVGSHLWAGFDDYANSRSVPGLWLGMEGGLPRFHLNTGGVNPGYFRMDGSKIEMNIDAFSSSLGVFSYLVGRDLLMPTKAALAFGPTQGPLIKQYLTYQDRTIVAYAHTKPPYDPPEFHPHGIDSYWDLFGMTTPSQDNAKIKSDIVTGLLPFDEPNSNVFARFYDERIGFTCWHWFEADFGSGSPLYQANENGYRDPGGEIIPAAVFHGLKFYIMEPFRGVQETVPTTSDPEKLVILNILGLATRPKYFDRLIAYSDPVPQSVRSAALNTTYTYNTVIRGLRPDGVSDLGFPQHVEDGRTANGTVQYRFEHRVINGRNRLVGYVKLNVDGDNGLIGYRSGQRLAGAVMLDYPANPSWALGYSANATPYYDHGGSSARFFTGNQPINYATSSGPVLSRYWRYRDNWGMHFTLHEDTRGKGTVDEFSDDFIPSFIGA